VLGVGANNSANWLRVGGSVGSNVWKIRLQSLSTRRDLMQRMATITAHLEGAEITRQNNLESIRCSRVISAY